MITCIPETRKEKVSEASFLILACDGIWDCLTSQEAVDFIGNKLNNKKVAEVSASIEDMFDTIIASDVASSGGIGCDNMTCIVIKFSN